MPAPGFVLAPLLLLGIQAAAPGPAYALSTPAETTREETLAPGLTHVEIVRAIPTASGAQERWVIHVLQLDALRAQLRVAPALDAIVGTETTSSLAERHGALAAVNGGYFRMAGLYRGEPAGALVLEGRLLSETDRHRPAVAVSGASPRTRVAFTRLLFDAAVVADKAVRLRVSGFNRARGTDEIVVYTPEFHRTTLTGRGGFEATVSRGKVVAAREGTGSSPIPADGFVVSASGRAMAEAARVLRRGARARLEAPLRTEPPLPFHPETLLGGGPWLLHGGAPASPLEGEPYAEDFLERRHPRTAIGVHADGSILLVTVDGRQPGWSDGMTIGELTALMSGLGCGEALNLDGGGSTAMVVRGQVVNRPSDATGERPVSDAILVFAR